MGPHAAWLAPLARPRVRARHRRPAGGSLRRCQGRSRQPCPGPAEHHEMHGDARDDQGHACALKLRHRDERGEREARRGRRTGEGEKGADGGGGGVRRQGGTSCWAGSMIRCDDQRRTPHAAAAPGGTTFPEGATNSYYKS